ncbi:hypothetical protein KZZ08_00645 [Roseovarius mucosus]|uniref:hypothetical protein n=1 Tax=Roseovarius mucosus TaxID=215743 RepID=UPI001C5E545A|nr:hypothetical protein [Roseovarius mucosus]MBW4972104.1 hypothetical protein [Roseovarius mucosus]
MIVFEDDMFRVTSRWFGGWRVVFKPTGSTLVPTQDQTVRIGLLWQKIRHGKYQRMSPPGRLAEDLMFLGFAHAVLTPDSEMAYEFVGMDLEKLAFAIVSEANIQHTANNLSRRPQH